MSVTLIGDDMQMNPLDGDLLEAVAKVIMKDEVRADLNQQDLSNIIWACGILAVNPCEGRMLPILAAKVCDKIEGFTQQVRLVGKVHGLCNGG